MAALSVWEAVLDAVVTGVQGLSLTGVSSGNVVRVWSPRLVKGVDSAPRVWVYPAGAEDQPGTLTGVDDISYPVGVTMARAGNQDREANIPAMLEARQKVFRYFRNQRLSGVSEIQTCRAEPGPVLDPGKFADNVLWWTITLRFVSREARGV